MLVLSGKKYYPLVMVGRREGAEVSQRAGITTGRDDPIELD